jgi:(p)ppGpp synthase/HD superfamily hydrolase
MTIEQAKQFFRDAHDSIGQKRKFSNLPYWVHTEEVSDIVAMYGGTQDMIIAALGHDVLEDVFPKNPKYSFVYLADTFGPTVANLILELTDVYIKEAFPKLNRFKRKALEAERVAQISPEAKTIKLADIMSNTRDITQQDKGFAPVFLREVKNKFEVLSDATSKELYEIVKAQIELAEQKL